ncbi:hypothetical protein HZC35_06650 [Candidatus Saganbacteria bacterium]|nr:hypothetical protein [Candidatus Saganbacteria bacterium]
MISFINFYQIKLGDRGTNIPLLTEDPIIGDTPRPISSTVMLQCSSTELETTLNTLLGTLLAPRDGDFLGAYRSVSTGDSADIAVGCLAGESGNSGWGAENTISALRIRAQYYASRGRFLRELKFYDEAQNNFNTAKVIYNFLLNGGALPNQGSLFNHAMSIADSIRREIRSDSELQEALPVEFAELELAMMRPDNFITDEKIYQRLSVEEFNRILLDDGNPQTRSSVTERFEDFHRRLNDSVRFSKTRSFISEANFLLELAKRLRVRNMDHAHTAADRAIDICLQELNAGHGDSEVRLSALLTLAWAYNTKASLMEEAESGTGREFALKAAAIYTFLLFGQTGLAGDEDLSRTMQNSPELQTLFSRYAGDMEVISNSLESVLHGGPIKTSGTDILQRNATNELELYLNLANAMSLARKYDGELGALTILGKLQDLQPRLNPQVELRDSFFQRVQLADANINMAYLSRLYGETRDLGLLQKFLEVKDNLQTTLTWFQQKVDGLIRADADIKLIDQYSLDFFRGYDTLAWVYSTLGRIEKNEQGLWDGLAETDYLALAENYYQGIRLQDGREVEGDKFVGLANSLCRLMRGTDDLSDRLIKMEIETYITWPQAYLHRGELERELENFDVALLDLGQVTVDDASYYSAQLSIAEIKLVQAQRIFTQSGNASLTRQNIESLLFSINEAQNTEMPPAIRIRTQLLIARLHEALGRSLVQELDRTGALEHFKQALSLYDQLLSDQSIRQIMEQELFITPDLLLLAKAETLKAMGERDLVMLDEAETVFEAITFATDSLRGLEAEISHFELQALRNKYLITQGLYQDSGLILLTAEDEERLTILKDALLSQGANRLAYRALSTFAWLLDQRAKITEVTQGEGRGREDYKKAADLYMEILGNSTLSDNRFLQLMDVFNRQIVLARAENLKSATARSADNNVNELQELHRQADDAYQQVLLELEPEEENSHLSYLITLAQQDAHCGQTENRIALGQLQEEEGHLPDARASYEQALALLAPALEYLTGRQRVRYLTESRVGLRTVSGLTWALNSLGGWWENSAEDESEEQSLINYRAASRVYRALLLGDNPWQESQAPLVPNLDDLIGFINRNLIPDDGSIMISDEVLFAAEQSRWAPRFGYFSSLNSSRNFGLCGNAYRELIGDIEGAPVQGIFEMKYSIRTHALMGDIDTFRLASYSTARDIYSRALGLFDEYQRQFTLPREMEEIRQYINSGYAKALLEGGHYYEAKDKYFEIFCCSLFQTIDLEIRQENPDDHRIAELRKELTFKQIRILAQAYLGLGTLYTHYLRDGEEAKKYYDYALRLLGAADTRAPINRMRGESYLGLGNVSLLRDRDAASALALFSEGARALTERDLEQITLEDATLLDRKSREVLVRILSAASAAYAEKTSREKAEQLIDLADSVQATIPADQYEPDYQEIVEGAQETRVGNAENLASQSYSLEPYAGFRRSAFESQENSGFLAGFIGRAHLTDDLNIDIGYANLLAPADIPINKEIDRIIFDRSHQVTAGIDWQAYEGDIFSLHFAPRFNFNYFGYDLNSCDWGTSYTSCSPLPVQDKSLLTYGFSLGTDFLMNHSLTPDLTLIWGGGIDASLLLRQGMYPSYDAQIASYREDIASLNQATNPDQTRIDSREGYIEQIEDHNENFLYSFLGRAQIGLQSSPVNWGDDFMLYYPTLTVGGIFGYDQIAITEQGRWPLFPIRMDETTGAPLFDEIPAWRGAATLGGSTILAWGDEFKYRLSLSFNLQIGNFTYFDINAGFNPGVDWLNLLLGYSHYEDYRDNVVDNLNLGLRFDLP